MTKIKATNPNIAAICDRLADKEITIAQASEETGWAIYTDEGSDENPILVPWPNTIFADDGNAEIDYDDMSAEEAAQEYVNSGDWGDRDHTMWFTIYTWREGINENGEIVRWNEDTHTITLDPDEPDCKDGQEHDWQSPHKILGGIEENPGVWGHGGGVIIHEVCMHCGCERVTDTWAGEQGLRSVEYEAEKYADEVTAGNGEE